MSSYSGDSDTGYESLLEMIGEGASISSDSSSTHLDAGDVDQNAATRDLDIDYNKFVSNVSAETILINRDDSTPDEDLLNDTLIDISKSFTGEVSNVYRLMKEKLLAGESQRNAAKDRVHLAAISQQNDEIHSLLEEISMEKIRLTNQLALTKRVIDHSSNRMKHTRDIWTGKHSLLAVFQQWHQNTRWEITNRYRTFIAAKHYCIKLYRQSFSTWRGYSYSSSKYTLNRFWQSRMEETQSKIIKLYEDKNSLYSNQLKQTIEERDEAVTKVNLMEDHLKQVFLSGVNAMNMSAINLFSKLSPTRRKKKNDIYSKSFSLDSIDNEANEHTVTDAVEKSSSSSNETSRSWDENPRMASIPTPVDSCKLPSSSYMTYKE